MLQMSQGRLLSLSSDPVGSSGFSVPSPSALPPPTTRIAMAKAMKAAKAAPKAMKAKKAMKA